MPRQADAGANASTEITPEMIRAGVDILADYDPEYDSLTKTVTKILEAALETKRLRAAAD
jgi:hypothetical protein